MVKGRVIHRSEKSSRVLEIELNGKILSTPTYFPAISSYGVKPPFSDLLYLLHYHKYPRVLVSAYDLFHMKRGQKRKVSSLMKKFSGKGFIFMDSGLFESSWRDDEKWDVDSYRSILSKGDFDLYTSFDIYRNDRIYEDFKQRTFDNILESSVSLNNVAFFAVVHESSPANLLRLIGEYLEEHAAVSSNIAIAERDTGKSILERAKTILEIRKRLDDYDGRNILHVLGCGNPYSMLLYSFCGADTFDSLDWLRFVANPNDYSCLHDFAYLDFLNCKCRVCAEMPYGNSHYLERVLLHNLLFYQNFVMQIQSLIRDNNLKAYLKRHIRSEIMKHLE